MRIGMVAGEYPPMEGGVGAFTRELGQALVNRGHDIHVFTRQQASQPSTGTSIQIEAAVTGSWGWRTSRLIDAWIVSQRLEIINIQFQTAAFDMHPAIHWLPFRINRVPVVVTFHDLREPYLFPKAHFIGARQWIVRRLAFDADGIISTDHADETRLRRDWHLDRVVWIPIGSNVDPTLQSDFDRLAWRSQLGVDPGDLLISYFGFLNESKGGLVLVDALARLHQIGLHAHLVMIGGRAGTSDPTNHTYGQQVDNRIAALNLESFVHWTGFVDDRAVSAYFAASDLTTLPYLDGVSLRRGTLMAALAHGQPIVTTAPSSSIPELDGVMVTVPSDDVNALATAIGELWYDASRRERLALAARHTASLFRWDVIANRTLEFYASLLAAQS